MRPLLTIIWAPAAARELDHLPRSHREQVEAAVDHLALTGLGDVVPIKGSPGIYRLRSGDYRALFERESDALVILFVRRRDHAY